MTLVPSPVSPAAAPPASTGFRKAAQAMESLFLAEMLKAAMPDGSDSAFGGGEGEAQFTSFLRDEQARAITSAGGIGLAETIVRSMEQRAGGSHAGA